MYDYIIIGSGPSGSFLAKELTAAGKNCSMLEAGHHLDRTSFPDNEMDANAQLYWGGGIELNTDVDLALLRPKVVGGGTIVNQALLDRMYDQPLASWRQQSGVGFFNPDTMRPYYERAESCLKLQEVPEDHWNDNVRIFRDGFDASGFKWARLRRAQGDCRYGEGNDCIECLGGCPLDSKQSMLVTVLKTALDQGLTLTADCLVTKVLATADTVTVYAKTRSGLELKQRAKRLILAAGSVGNTTLLIKSGMQNRLPALGQGFFTHPQEMSLGIYDRKIEAYKGAFQALCSDDQSFRDQGFKLENIFGPPASLAMLFPQRGHAHQEIMQKIPYMGCVEVAVRDTNPGTIRVDAKGRTRITKTMNEEDKQRKKRGLEAIQKVLGATGAKEVYPGEISIGLHLMGGLAIGTNRNKSCVDQDFRLHGFTNIFAADSSIFPNAPGINPSLTVMANSLRAADILLAN